MKVNSITIIGRRWFERQNGNTYHSADILVNGKQVHRIDFTYGYGEMYIQNATEWLDKNGYLPKLKHHDNGSFQPLWDYARENGIAYHYSVSDVSRKKDL